MQTIHVSSGGWGAADGGGEGWRATGGGVSGLRDGGGRDTRVRAVAANGLDSLLASLNTKGERRGRMRGGEVGSAGGSPKITAQPSRSCGAETMIAGRRGVCVPEVPSSDSSSTAAYGRTVKASVIS